jgi:hypothetical protein
MFVPKKVEHKNRVNFTNYCDIKPYPDAWNKIKID